MTTDHRLALLTHDGDVLYPYIKEERASGRTGFALSQPGGRDAKCEAVYTTDLAAVIRHVLFDGWKVRARSMPPAARREGSYGIQMRAIAGYWLSPEFAPLASGAPVAPQQTVKPVPVVPQALWPFPAGVDPTPEEIVEALTVEEYVDALSTLESYFTPQQRTMLLGHAVAPDHTLSMEAISALGGYGRFNSANVQYGRLAHHFAAHFGVEDLANQTQALAYGKDPVDDHAPFQWVLRASLVEALQVLGWIDLAGSASPEMVGATEQLKADPQFRELSPTVRQALINARIGQGAYRQRMLNLWGGQCAVTGCAVSAVLIASHAKPWATSSNLERLDEFNGLLLSASIDRLFDRGLISFNAQGCLLKKQEIQEAELQRLGTSSGTSLSRFDARHVPYLAAHRSTHGFDD